jgi:hypothetical protein
MTSDNSSVIFSIVVLVARVGLPINSVPVNQTIHRHTRVKVMALITAVLLSENDAETDAA